MLDDDPRGSQVIRAYRMAQLRGFEPFSVFHSGESVAGIGCPEFIALVAKKGGVVVVDCRHESLFGSRVDMRHHEEGVVA